MMTLVLKPKDLPLDELMMYEFAHSEGVKNTYAGICIRRLLWKLRGVESASLDKLRDVSEYHGKPWPAEK
jgi:hypothetical protein